LRTKAATDVTTYEFNEGIKQQLPDRAAFAVIRMLDETKGIPDLLYVAIGESPKLFVRSTS
jgi:hypothetical protein